MHRWILAALLEELKDLNGWASFESRSTGSGRRCTEPTGARRCMWPVWTSKLLSMAKPDVIVEILEDTGVHGWILAALLEEMHGPGVLNLARPNSGTHDAPGKVAWRRGLCG